MKPLPQAVRDKLDEVIRSWPEEEHGAIKIEMSPRLKRLGYERQWKIVREVHASVRLDGYGKSVDSR